MGRGQGGKEATTVEAAAKPKGTQNGLKISESGNVSYATTSLRL